MYAAAGSIRFDGMTLFGNGVRPDPSTFPVSGSYTVVPVPLKSPALIASVAMVRNAEADNRRVVRSQSAKKNSLFFTIGPPIVPPNWCCTFFGSWFGSPLQEYRQ